MMKKLMALVLLTLLALSLLTACGGCGDKGNSSGSGMAWPKDKMGDLPELKGNILGVIDTPQGVSVTIENVIKSEYEAYVAELNGLGYEATLELDDIGGTSSMFQGKNEVGDTISVQHHSDQDACIIIYGESLGY